MSVYVQVSAGPFLILNHPSVSVFGNILLEHREQTLRDALNCLFLKKGNKHVFYDCFHQMVLN